MAILDSLHSAAWSSIAVLCYITAFIANIAHSALDSELDYAVDRDSSFYTSSLPEKFIDRVETWRILNSVKCVALILAWFAVWPWIERGDDGACLVLNTEDHAHNTGGSKYMVAGCS